MSLNLCMKQGTAMALPEEVKSFNASMCNLSIPYPGAEREKLGYSKTGAMY